MFICGSCWILERDENRVYLPVNASLCFSFFLSFFFFFHFWFLFVLQGGVCVCNCQKHTARRGEEMELKVDWVTTWHQGTCQRGPRSPYIPNVGPGAPTSAAPFRTPPSTLWYANCGCGSTGAGKRAEAFRRLTRYKAANFKARFKRVCSHPAK